jgi:hypothetical protein
MPIKTQPTMDSPKIGLTKDDPGKCVLGSVPVEEDGSAHFKLPSGVAVFFQALDKDDVAVQTMRSLTYVQPGQTLSCIGCHERRTDAPPPLAHPLAASREASRIAPGPEGSWPYRYDRLVQPVLESKCVSCHRADAKDKAAAKTILTADKSYDTLVNFGKPSLKEEVLRAYADGRSIVGRAPSRVTPLMKLLEKHYDVALSPDERERLVLWMDTYAQRAGSFSDEQEQMLRQFRDKVKPLLTH